MIVAPTPTPEPPPPMLEDRRELITLSVAANVCGVDYDTFLSWVRKGVLPHVVVGPAKSKRVYRRDAEALIQPGS